MMIFADQGGGFIVDGREAQDILLQYLNNHFDLVCVEHGWKIKSGKYSGMFFLYITYKFGMGLNRKGLYCGAYLPDKQLEAEQYFDDDD